MDSLFLFPLPCQNSLGQSQDLDLLIYISDVSPYDFPLGQNPRIWICQSISDVSPFSGQSLLTILLLIVLSYSNLLQFTFSLSPPPSLILPRCLILPHHLVTLSPCHLVTLSPHHLVTSSPHHLVTSSLVSPQHHNTLHQDTLLPYHSITLILILTLTLSHP